MMKKIFLVMLTGLITCQTLAVMSGDTGRIHGRAPTVTGTLTILLPDGSTELTEGAQVSWTASPSDFTLGPLTPGLTYSDEDGDLPATLDAVTLANPPGVSWTWMQGATVLTPAQVSQPFQNNFADGTVLTVSASVPVIVASASGLPDFGEQTLTTPDYNVIVKMPPPPPVIYVNGTTFGFTDGFPTTGFENAQFQFYMNGVDDTENARYTYVSNQPGWASVTPDGVVSFDRKPATPEKAVTITITDTAGVVEPSIYTFSVATWFDGHLPVGMYTQPESIRACESVGQYLPRLAELTNAVYIDNGNGTGNGGHFVRVVGGGLTPEWGDVTRFAIPSTDLGYLDTWVIDTTPDSSPYGLGYRYNSVRLNTGANYTQLAQQDVYFVKRVTWCASQT